MTNKPVLKLDALHRVYHQGGEDLPILRGANLEIQAGEMVALVGPSGSGKTTLLQLAGLLEKPDKGDVLMAGEKTSRLSDNKRTRLRSQHAGFVFQSHHLLPEFTALENVVMPQIIAGTATRKAEKVARELLASVGLVERMTHRPTQLSGGEQQRVAVARALANSPKILIADEPTGNLDVTTSQKVFEMILELTRLQGMSALIATHSRELASKMDRAVTLVDGEIHPVSLI